MRIIKHTELENHGIGRVDNTVDVVDERVTLLSGHSMRGVHRITNKFYSRHDIQAQPNSDTVAFVRRALEAGPRDKLQVPETESQRYGWYWDVRFSDSEILRDDRLNFHRKSNPLIKLQTAVNLASKLNRE